MRTYVTQAELLTTLNAALATDDTCTDCQFTQPVRLVSPPQNDGLNWSAPKLRCSGTPVEVCKEHALATVDKVAQQFSLRHDDGWLYDVCFNYRGRRFVAVNEAVGVSTGAPARPSNARWSVSVDAGGPETAFDSSLSDTDPDVLRARIIQWYETTHGA